MKHYIIISVILVETEHDNKITERNNSAIITYIHLLSNISLYALMVTKYLYEYN